MRLPPAPTFGWLLLLNLLAVTAATASETAALTEAFRPLAKEYCTACHNAEKTEGEIDLEALLAKPETLWGDGKLLDLLHDAVTDGDMPPKKAKKKLGAAEREQIRVLLDRAVASLAEHQRDDPGVVVMSRLTRNEYRNVIRDLSGGIVTKAGEYLPNEGGAGEGFANVGEAQGMSAAQFEKYIEAAKDALRHLRVSPHSGFVWSAVPRDAVDEPKSAIHEAADDLIAWHVAQQQQWGREHRDDLQARLGFNDAAYLEAAWRYRWRAELGKPNATFADIARGYDAPLAPVVLEKWFALLSATEPQEPFVAWAKTWRTLAADAQEVRQRCIEIVSGKADEKPSGLPSEGYAPPYEVSFHEAITEVVGAATERGVWPFRIAIGDAKELFFVVTDAGDGNKGESATWRAGRFQMSDGTAKPWQEVSKVTGANSGKEFAFGKSYSGRTLPADSIGVQPPGALRVTVPPGAVTFELELALDPQSVGKSSVQAIVLKEKPKSQSYIPGRMVFGGKKSDAREAKQDAQAKALQQALRKRNVAEANVTKIGLSAERNIFAAWTRTPLERIGGPWPAQLEDKEEPLAPYHLTVAQVRRNATAEDFAVLHELEERLFALAQPPSASALEAKACGLLDKFAEKAWRRQLNADDQAKLMQLYRDAAAQGVSFDSAMKVPLLTVLASSDFLYRGREADTFVQCAQDLVAGKKTLPQSSHALASRLSFFLWASIPDDELLRLAAADKLREPAVLVAQAKRMLKDPRAASLATDFAAQLWGFGDFESFTGPDEKRFAEFTRALRQAMFDEVTTFLTDLIRNDRPLIALLDADYTFANAELAKHYGVKTVPAGFERVALPPGRGGLPTMALFLTKTSLPLRTSPVQRGVWVVEQFLGRKIPPPPMNVGKISEDEKSADGLPIRDQLAKHRADANCAACHARFDAMGVALENFDPIGRWRTADRSGDAVVSTDTLQDGTELNGITGLKKYLRDHQDEVFRHFTRKLLGYALGRAVLPGDRALLDRMNSSLAQDGYKFSTLVEAIVTSPQFLNRRAP